jgi:hypothetical protein
MKVVRLLVTCGTSREEDESGAYALISLSEYDLRMISRRKKIFHDTRKTDPEFFEMYFWGYFAEFYSLGTKMRLRPDQEKEEEVLEYVQEILESGISEVDMGDLLQGEDGLVVLKEDDEVVGEVDRTDCDQMLVRENGICFYSLAKHTDQTSTTLELSYTLIEGLFPKAQLDLPFGS